MSRVYDKEAHKDLNMSWKKADEPKLKELSEKEMEAVTIVFRSFETGLREATIYTKVHSLRLRFDQHESSRISYQQ